MTNPSLILADEPTGNLDSKTEKVVMQTFQQMHSEGRTIVLITHEAEIAAYAQRVITMRDGRLVDDRLNGDAGKTGKPSQDTVATAEAEKEMSA